MLWKTRAAAHMAATRALLSAMRAAAMRSLQRPEPARAGALRPRSRRARGEPGLRPADAAAAPGRLRHEVEEWTSYRSREPWPEVAGWAALALPLISWVGAGWAAVYWLVITFRFMNRSEKVATLVILAMGVLVVPVYGVAVGLYGTSANPAVSADRHLRRGRIRPGPNRQAARPGRGPSRGSGLSLPARGAVQERPLLRGGLRGVPRPSWERDPSFVPAHINVGNIFYLTGTLRCRDLQLPRGPEHASRAHSWPTSTCIWRNPRIFHFKEAEQSLQRGPTHRRGPRGPSFCLGATMDRPPRAQDASLRMASPSGRRRSAEDRPSDAVARQAGIGIAGEALALPQHLRHESPRWPCWLASA